MLTQLLKIFRYIALFLFSATALADYSDVYIFGDSLSDTGNLASVTADLPFPYYMNRVTNGPVAVEVIYQAVLA